MSDIILGYQQNHHGHAQPIRIKSADRRGHTYIIGKTGTEKSTLAANMIINDIRSGAGCALIDPHGDLIDSILRHIPASRTNDVVLFDPSDEDFPIGFNILEPTSSQGKQLAVSALVSVFRHLFRTSWGPRSEFILHNCTAALLDNPEPMTLLDVYRMLVDAQFCQQVAARTKDPIVRFFWTEVFAKYNDRFANEVVSPLLNKVGQLLTVTYLRNIVGQPKSTINLQRILDNRHIFLVRLPKGIIGEDRANLLGSTLITKLYLAALERQAIPEHERQDFYLYVDEYESFATDSFPSILSEARKYHLNLTLINQYLDQVPRDNIGQVISQLNDYVSQFVVFVNRYDGIDLPDDVCRILVLDGLPGEWSLFKLNEAAARTESPIIRREQAQKIEQGLGRGVRSQADHCVVILMRNNLISFMSKAENQGFFTPETRAQVEIGQTLAGILKQQKSNSFQAIIALIDQCLSRDAGWQQYHSSRVQLSGVAIVSQDAVSIAQAESEAWHFAMRSQHDRASDHVAKMINDHTTLVDADRGCYLQLQASYQCHVDRSSAFEKQLKAHELNTSLLNPPAGVRYRRLTARQTTQAANIRDWVQTFNEPNGLVADFNRVFESLVFGGPEQEFVAAFRELATMLGFHGHRPELEYCKGPDILWRMTDSHFLVVEAKNMVYLSREKIFKRDAEQIGGSTLWFRQEYPDQLFTPMLIHPANTLSTDAFIPPECKVMQPAHLQALVTWARSLVSALASKPLIQWSVEEIARQVNDHKLNPGQIRNEYLGGIKPA